MNFVVSREDDAASRLAYELAIPYLVAKILVNRGIKNPEESRVFLYGGIQDLHSPFLFLEMEKAIERIRKAIKEKEKIFIFGDYDADGISATALLTRGLSSLGAIVEPFIPNRLSHGYGIKKEFIDRIKSSGATVVITVDNGIKAFDFAEAALREGIDFIITDHHLPDEDLPQAYAIINPHVALEAYPDKYLSGVGVAFKLLHALFLSFGKEAAILPYLKVAALGTVADMVELKGENRIIVKEGLKQINTSTSYGLFHLIKSAGLGSKKITTVDIAFRLAPRLNAAGRMEDASIALQLLLSRNEREAQQLAQKLNSLNSSRQRMEERILKEAMELAEREEGRVIFLASSSWHRGVIGIVAHKLVEKFERPAFLFELSEGVAYGSGRSVEGVPLIEGLKAARNYLLSYGGHELAAGAVLEEKHIERVRQIVEEVLSAYEPKEKVKLVDAEIQFSEISPVLVKFLSELEPFGIGNPEPLFLSRQVEVVSEPVLFGNNLKFYVRQREKVLPAVVRGRTDWLGKIRKGDVIDLLYNIRENRFSGCELAAQHFVKR